MSLSLNLGTRPAGVEIKTFGFGSMEGIVHLGGYEISMADFLMAVAYVLTNTDLKPGDPRLQFMECVRSMKVVDGYNPNTKRLESSVPPVILPT